MTLQNNPASLLIAKILLGVISISHIVIPVIMVLNKTSISMEIALKNPSFDVATVTESLNIALRSAVIFHSIIALICIVGIVALSYKKRWSRRFVTVSQSVSVIFSIISWSTSSMFHAVIPFIDIVAIIVIVLVWHPATRVHFNREISNE